MSDQTAFIREIEIRYKLRPILDGGPLGKPVNSPQSVYQLFQDLRQLNDEHLYAVFVDSANRIQSIYLAAKGGGAFASTDIASLLRAALAVNCSGIILVHNHPSGSLRPSPSDRKFTQTLARACRMIDLRLLDHVIIGHGDYFSFANEGLIKGRQAAQKKE